MHRTRYRAIKAGESERARARARVTRLKITYKYQIARSSCAPLISALNCPPPHPLRPHSIVDTAYLIKRFVYYTSSGTIDNLLINPSSHTRAHSPSNQRTISDSFIINLDKKGWDLLSLRVTGSCQIKMLSKRTMLKRQKGRRLHA